MLITEGDHTSGEIAELRHKFLVIADYHKLVNTDFFPQVRNVASNPRNGQNCWTFWVWKSVVVSSSYMRNEKFLIVNT